MCQDNCNTKDESSEGYRHLTYKDRVKIEGFYNDEGIDNKAEIARRLDFSRSTISREIKRGLTKIKNSDLTYTKIYSADLGQIIKNKLGKRKGPDLVISKNSEIADFIEEKIKAGYSPEVIANWIKKSDDFKITICAKTIYNYLHKGLF